MTPTHLRLGNRAERLAVLHLKRKGHKLLARNFTTKKGEIDIITSHKELIVFTEVKSGVIHPGFSPRDRVNREKAQKIETVAEIYLRKHRLYGKPIRFDLIEVNFRDVNDRQPQIFHLEGGV